MYGFIYRRAAALKDFGERNRIAVFIRLGLAIRGLVLRFPVSNFIGGGE
jgi:hypothetical protein